MGRGAEIERLMPARRSPPPWTCRGQRWPLLPSGAIRSARRPYGRCARHSGDAMRSKVQGLLPLLSVLHTTLRHLLSLEGKEQSPARRVSLRQWPKP